MYEQDETEDEMNKIAKISCIPLESICIWIYSRINNNKISVEHRPGSTVHSHSEYAPSQCCFYRPFLACSPYGRRQFIVNARNVVQSLLRQLMYLQLHATCVERTLVTCLVKCVSQAFQCILRHAFHVKHSIHSIYGVCACPPDRLWCICATLFRHTSPPVSF